MKNYANRITQRTVSLIILCLFVLPINNQCKKIADNPTIPVVTTIPATAITQVSANSGITIISEGESTIIEEGICWSVNPSPLLSDNVLKWDSRHTTYISNLKNLKAATVYYVRSYAINQYGIGFGNTITFTTLPFYLPEVTTLPVMQIKQTSCTSGGTILSTGGSAILFSGICFSTENNPDISNFTTSDQVEGGAFTSFLNRLTPNTTYYLRAYATNLQGTGYGNLKTIRTSEMDSTLIIDNDNNTYPVVRIGSQLWMGENLKVTTYKDGTPLKLISNKEEWLTYSGSSYCWYNNDENKNKIPHGALYNWYTVTGENLCPTGWHIPSLDEWELLHTTLGDSAGGKLKSTDNKFWVTPNLGATNETSFNAYPSGVRNIFGDFTYMNSGAYFWSNTSRSDGFEWSFSVNYGGVDLYRVLSTEHEGFSIRCVKNL